MRTVARLAGECGLCAVLSVVLLVWLFDLPHRDLRMPLNDQGDALGSLMVGKAIIDHGWPLNNPDLGAPHGSNLHDFQCSDTLHFMFLKLLSLIVTDPFLLANLYFLFTFPLTALIALVVFRHFRLPYWPALTASLLYAFLPYHSLRGLGHLFLAAYFVLPLAVAVILWVFQDEPLFWRPGRDNSVRQLGCTRKGWASVAIAVVVACSGVYYGFFACFFLLTAGLAAGWRKGRWMPSAAALLLILVVTATTLLNFLPQFVNNRVHGPNREAGARSTSDAEHYALRMSQMVMPTSGHRVPLLDFAKQRFNAKITQVTESDMAALGLLGTVGLFYLLALLLVRPVEAREDSRCKDLHALSILNVAAILVGSMGGFSLLIASVFPPIRCYNRLSVYIAFFALFALAHLLQRLCERLPNRPAGRAIGALFCAGLAVLGAWEQTPATTSVISITAASAFASDGDFVHQLEDRLPAGSMIFQMPYSTFPEGRSYEHLRLYLHSHSLKWSFGAMRGRYADLWQRHVVGQPTEEMASTLAWSGFAGVCWDRQASAAGDSDREAGLRALLGEPALFSADGRVAFYSLERHAAKLRRSTSPEQAEECRQDALHPLLVCWGPGFQQIEDPRPFGGRWSNARGDLVVFNPGDAPRSLRLQIKVRTAQPGPATLRLQGPGLQQKESIDGEPRVVQVQLIAPPGRSCVYFHCDGAAHPEHERRVFQVVDYAVKAAPAPASRSTIARGS